MTDRPAAMPNSPGGLCDGASMKICSQVSFRGTNRREPKYLLHHWSDCRSSSCSEAFGPFLSTYLASPPQSGRTGQHTCPIPAAMHQYVLIEGGTGCFASRLPCSYEALRTDRDGMPTGMPMRLSDGLSRPTTLMVMNHSLLPSLSHFGVFFGANS
jgi:hypothetical protein